MFRNLFVDIFFPAIFLSTVSALEVIKTFNDIEGAFSNTSGGPEKV